jgi:mitogen-activated protein kinase kinase 1
MNNNDNNYEKNNDENIFDNININNINEAENLKYSLDQNSKLESKNIESSLILKQKFNKMNESQISYDASNMSINHLNDHNKIKKKKKLSLYDLQKLALLGAGSSGEVYLVQDTETKKKLALKTVKYTEDEKTKNQLETEVKLSTIKHENIIRIYATYFLKGKINFVMEYMDRGTIADLLKKVKKIPEKFVGLITYQVVKGMAYCQKEKRIIHRDLKPSNILVNSKGEIKISDFGVSTIVESSWAQKKTMIGTYIYMAPERIDADIYYINCDVWSLGIIVMECILGYYPYIIYNNNVLPNTVWIVHDLIENNPVPKLDENIYSQELIDFSNQCLTKDIKKRPTAEKLLNHPFLQRYANSSRDDLALWLKSIN